MTKRILESELSHTIKVMMLTMFAAIGIVVLYILPPPEIFHDQRETLRVFYAIVIGSAATALAIGYIEINSIKQQLQNIPEELLELEQLEEKLQQAYKRLGFTSSKYIGTRLVEKTITINERIVTPTTFIYKLSTNLPIGVALDLLQSDETIARLEELLDRPVEMNENVISIRRI